jgi:paraquat-inducible protein A
MTTTAVTATEAGLLSCETCGLLVQPASAAEPGYCPRCGTELAARRHRSVERTWAFVIAATICYIPANLLPVLGTTTLGSTEYDTIMGGVVFLYTSGSWPLALVVLIASVMVPLGKLIALSYLLISVQRGWVPGGKERTRVYRMVEFVGRWSMLDVFVDTFTVALVQLNPLMSVQPGPGVLFFAAVVVLTMIAAATFDPRLIWDAGSRQAERQRRVHHEEASLG